MKYLNIKAETYQEAIEKLRKEHGVDAVPISHKKITVKDKQGGGLKAKLFGRAKERQIVELTAAVKEVSPRRVSSGTSSFDRTVGERLSPVKDVDLGRVQEIIDRAVTAQGVDLNLKKDIPRGGQRFKVDDIVEDKKNYLSSTFKDDSSVEANEREADSSRESFRGIEKEVNEIKLALNRLLEKEKQNESIVSADYEENEILSSCREMLRDNDFEPEDCDMIIREVRRTVSTEDLKDKFSIEKSLKDLLKSRIMTTGPIGKSSRKKIMMFVGPTGVGKTTTLAKLGAIQSLREGEKVSFITIDVYRIAATEQLKKYAEIIGIPIHVVSDQKKFKEVVADEKANLILVDTSGRSHKNDLNISEIKSFADSIDADLEKVLCVSANTKKGDLKNIFSAFDVMDFDSVIITKVDESSFLGNVVDVADKYNKPISYYTDGQEVPNNIHVADPDGIAGMMMGDSA